MPVFQIGLEDGRSLRIEADSQEAALAGAQHFVTQEEPSGIVAGVRKGLSDIPHGVAETLKNYLGAGDDPAGLNTVAGKVAPENYKGASIIDQQGVHLGNVPQAIAEQAPGLATDIAAARLAARIAGPRAGIVTGLGSFAARNLGITADERAKSRTGDDNAAPNAEDKIIAGGTTGAQALLDRLVLSRFLPGGSKATEVGTKGVTEAATRLATTAGIGGASSGAQDVVGQVGNTVGTDQGVKIDPYQALNAAATGAVTTGAIGTPRAAADAHSAVINRDFGGDNAPAAAAVANRINDRADERSLTNTKVGREAVQSAGDEIKTELRDAVKDLKTRTDLNTETTNALDRAMRGLATKSDLALIEGTPGAHESGVRDLARQAGVVARLKQMGSFGDETFTGGLSSKLDKLRPIYNPTATAASAVAAAFHSQLPGMIGMYSLPVLGGVYGSYVGARALDKLSGARSPAKRFVDRFSDDSTPVRPAAIAAPPAAPTGTSVPRVPRVPTPWGAEPGPDDSLPKSTVTVETGMAKIAQKLAAEKKRQNITTAEALLRKLAEREGPNAPINLPDGFASTLSKGDGVIDLPNPLAKAQTPTEVPTDLMRRMKTFAQAMQHVKGLREKYEAGQVKAEGTQAAEQLAAASPMVDSVGGLGAVRNPEMGKRAGQLVAAVNAMRKLTAQPEAEGTEGVAELPQPIVVQKITKKANGKIKQTVKQPEMVEEPAVKPVEEDLSIPDFLRRTRAEEKVNGKSNGHAEPSSEFVPLGDHELYKKGKSDQQVASEETAKETNVYKKRAYQQAIVKARQERRNILSSIADDHVSDADTLGKLLDQLDHTRGKTRAREAIAHYTKMMTPQAAAAVREANARLIATWKHE